jgi:hypothetical protein
MRKSIVVIAIVVLVLSTVGSAGQHRPQRRGINQQQSTSLVVSGETAGWGSTETTIVGSVNAHQSAGSGGSRARQSASTSIGSTSSSWWGAVTTWFCGWAETWQSQSVNK